MQAYRASLLRFDDAGNALFDQDGLLVVEADARGRQVVKDAGAWSAQPDAVLDSIADVPAFLESAA